jgi:hypothetical protein
MNQQQTVHIHDSNQRLRILLKKSKGFIQDKKDMRPFKEPIVFLIRRGGKVEFYEGIKEDVFRFTHSDNEEYDIQLRTFPPLTFEYGSTTFRGYVLDEDNPFPLPQKPKLYIDQFKMIIEKVWVNVQSRKALETKAITGLLKMVVIGIAVIIGGYILYKTMVRGDTETAKVIAENATAVVQNASIKLMG